MTIIGARTIKNIGVDTDIKITVDNILNKNLNSAPGYDGVVYEYLLKMPFLHQVMATAFTKS